MAGTPVQPMLVQVRDAPDAGGEAAVGLLVPPPAGSPSRRPVLQVYASLSAAIDAKRRLEEIADARSA